MRATNLTGGDLFAHQSPRLSHYQQIGNDQGWMIDPSLLLESLFVEQYQVGQGPPLRATFSNMNFAFFQTRGESERSFGGLHFHGSPLYNHLVRLAKSPSGKIARLRKHLRSSAFSPPSWLVQ